MTGLAYPAADVLALTLKGEGLPPDLVVTVMGLTGPSGVLPRRYTEEVNASVRSNSESLRDFLDMLSHRLLALFATAGTKYRPHRISETSLLSGKSSTGQQNPLTAALLSLTGYGTSHLVDRMATGADPLLHYAGFFSGQTKSAERLRALASDWLGRPVEVRQFVGAWLPLSQDQRTRLPGPGKPAQFSRLGMKLEAPAEIGTKTKPAARDDAAIGVRAWDVQAGVILRVGPLDHDSFNALLPDHPMLERLVALVRAYLGGATNFAINPVVTAREVPPLELSGNAEVPPRLGWNTWLNAPKGSRAGDAGDAVFQADIVEARTRARRQTARREAA